MNFKYNMFISKIKRIIDFVLVILLAFLSLKKGGFYKTDVLEFNLTVTFIGFCYIIFEYIINILKNYIKKKKQNNLNELNKLNNSNKQESKVDKKNKCKIDLIEFLLLLFSISYLLPIIIKNYSNLSDSIFEMIRYFNMYIIYVIVKKSNDKKVYINGIIGIVFVQCLIGIDGLANRYLLPLLNKIDSGYLTSNNVTRMSATIQYANVFSLICILVNVYVIDKFKNVTKLNKENAIEYFLIFVFTSSIILSKSRIILLILICYLIYTLINKDTKNKLLIILNIITSVVYSTIFMKLLLNNIQAIYMVTFFFYLVILIVYFMKDKILIVEENLSKVISSNTKNKMISKYVLCSVICIYLILGFCIKVPIKIDSDVNQNFVSRNIYNLKKDTPNEINIKIKRKHEDSRYKIDIYEVNNSSQSNLIKTYNYYLSISDSFKFSYTPKDNFKNLIVVITSQKEKIQVLELSVNNKSNYLDYVLLPTDIVYRTYDSINGDSSLKDRIYFTKDAIKLSTLNAKNFFFGIGGDGFKNTYEIVKSNNYFSTEVHNVYLQIFVESGIIGVIIFIAIIILCLKNCKFDIYKLLFIIFCISSFFDLNFSYMFTMAIFSIILALLTTKDNNQKFEISLSCVKVINFVNILIFSILSIIILVILINSCIALYTKVAKIESDNVEIELLNTSISNQERVVLLDPYENTYRYNLHLKYEKYLELYGSSVIEKMEKNLLEMLKNDKYDVEILNEISSEIIEYMDYFVNVKYSLNKEAGYEYYLTIILKNLECIENIKYNDEKIQRISEVYNQCFEKLNWLNEKEESDIFIKYIEILRYKKCKISQNT